jgi:hypothetical protein
LLRANPLGMLWPEMDAAFVGSAVAGTTGRPAGRGSASGRHHRGRSKIRDIDFAAVIGWCMAEV